MNWNENITTVGIGVIVLLLLIAWIIRRVIRRGQRIRSEANPRKITMKDIDKMQDGSEFELYLYHLFQQLGYAEVHKTTSSRDFGADLVFVDRAGRRNVIQAKRYGANHPVGLSAVQEIYTSMRYYEADRSIVLTSARYTEACRTLAAVNGVKLLDREDLMDLITLFKSRRMEEALELIEEDDQEPVETWQSRRKRVPR
ncbi:restriction endonuclease [Paenibacillus sp. UMB7766-LJ446]|jgi:restriction system protein|uniref:restriction endonuclease n=1 Tax=Paenibacillus TaxID=44249 RepID=UPI0009A33FEF|nr:MULTISPECIES: restriction endonuclease [Paenibacillus]OPG94471.1 endonuclease [Chryseobacterium mucoviscidosis]MDK8192685.1 restriction endonuclease [Paenibacillus sp. UMB7766-LJ446]MDN8588645.1 restriction endonuclease [Paenibacillus sp. 11B]OZQ64902.1 endonuclease [Paenibacillus taichungensis]HBU80350.1 restriction endonuclease [Paenibacillus sp.]